MTINTALGWIFIGTGMITFFVPEINNLTALLWGILGKLCFIHHDVTSPKYISGQITKITKEIIDDDAENEERNRTR